MKSFSQKIISALLLISIVATSFGALPNTAKALGGEIVFDVPNLIENVISVGNSAVTSLKAYSLELKAFVLDTLATTFAKMMIRRLTADVVQWIEGGFQGSPAFMTNPGGMFLDVADQISGEFLA